MEMIEEDIPPAPTSKTLDLLIARVPSKSMPFRRMVLEFLCKKEF
jgi:hypothetical protein